MFIKTLCLLLVLAVVAYGRPNGYYNSSYVDPGFSQYPNQGQFVPDAGFGNGNGQGGLPSRNDFHYGAVGGQARPGQTNHRHGYQEYGY